MLHMHRTDQHYTHVLLALMKRKKWSRRGGGKRRRKRMGERERIKDKREGNGEEKFTEME